MKFNSRYLLALIPIAIIGGALYYFSDIVTYVILAWVVSMLGAPIVKFLRRFLGKSASSVLTLGLFVVITSALVYIFIPPLLQQARNLAGLDYNKVLSSLEEPINDWENFLVNKGLIEQVNKSGSIDTVEVAPREDDTLTREALKIIRLDSMIMATGDTMKAGPLPYAIILNIEKDADKSRPDELEKTTGESFFDRVKYNVVSFINPGQVQKLFGSIIGFFGNFLVALLAILFIAFFFLKEQGLFGNMLSAIVPTEYESQTSKALNDTSDLLIRYFIGVATQIITITIFVGVAMGFLGIRNALLIGFFAALMNVIPYVGPILGASFAVIITISSNLDISFYDELLPLLIKVLAVFGVMQLLDNILLQPNIFGRSVKAHPLEIFIVVLMGAKIGGILGMVIAIPVYTVFRVIARVFFSEFKIVQRITQSMNEA